MKQEIIKGNKLIAEFMGGQYHRLHDEFDGVTEIIYFLPGTNPNPHCSAGTYKRLPDLDYHKRWDWLMPVIDRIEMEGVTVEITTKEISIYNNKGFSSRGWYIGTKINSVWIYLVRFIQWYNANKPL